MLTTMTMQKPCQNSYEKFFAYLAEREDLQVLDLGTGMALWRHEPNGLIYLHTVYVQPEHRRTGVGAYIADVLLQQSEAGLTTTVAPQANGSTESLLACLKSGFRVTHSDANLIYLYMPKQAQKPKKD